jgi:hypothetical protein
MKVADFTAGCAFEEVSFGFPNLSKKEFCDT